jgi:hypothetical protein
MADETLFGTRGYVSPIVAGQDLLTEKNFDTVTIKTGLTTAKAGDIVTHEGETYPDVDLRGTGEQIAGILIEQVVPNNETDDPDTVTVAGDYWKMLKLPIPVGVRVAMFTVGVQTIVKGSPMYAGAAGRILLWAYVTDDEETATTAANIGVSTEAEAGHATEERIVVVEGGVKM